MTKNRFKRGSGCFTCKTCRKQTRAAGDNEGTGLCPLCYYKSTCGNSLSDAGFVGNAWALFHECASESECETILAAELAKLPL